MNKTYVPHLCCLAAVAATILLYFAVLSNAVLAAIHFISLVAIVLAELITAGYICFLRTNPRSLGAAVVSGLMIPAAMVLSGVYIVNFPTGYGSYLSLYFVGLLITNAIACILLHFDGRRAAENEVLQDARGQMLNLRKLVKSILADPAAAPYADRLRAIEEDLHYSNSSVIAEEDRQIHQLLLQLRDDPASSEGDRLLSELELAVKRRAVSTSTTV